VRKFLIFTGNRKNLWSMLRRGWACAITGQIGCFCGMEDAGEGEPKVNIARMRRGGKPKTKTDLKKGKENVSPRNKLRGGSPGKVH